MTSLCFDILPTLHVDVGAYLSKQESALLFQRSFEFRYSTSLKKLLCMKMFNNSSHEHGWCSLRKCQYWVYFKFRDKHRKERACNTHKYLVDTFLYLVWYIDSDTYLHTNYNCTYVFHQSGLQWYPRNCFEGPKAPFSRAFCQCDFRKCFWKETEMNCLQFTELAMMYRLRMIVLVVFLFFISPRYLSNVWKNERHIFRFTNVHLLRTLVWVCI